MAGEKKFETLKAEFQSRKAFIAWLYKQPPEVCMAIAARAALRVLPLLGTLGKAKIKLPQARAEIFLPVLRAMALPWVAGKYPARFKDAAAFSGAAFNARGDARAARTTAAAYAAFSDNAAAAGVAEAAAFAARVAAYADATNPAAFIIRAAAAAFSVTVAFAVRPDDAVTVALTVKPDYLDPAVFAALDAFEVRPDAAAAAAAAATAAADDAAFVKTGGRLEALMRLPVWHGAPPEWVEEYYALLKKMLPPDEDWDVWTRWYEAIRDGREFGSEALERFRVLQPEEFWKQPPAAINRAIKDEERRLGLLGAVRESRKPAQKPANAKTKSTAASKPETVIGKAIIANHPALVIQAALLVAVLDAAIAEAKAKRPNSDEGKSEKKGAVQALESIRGKLLAASKAIKTFPQGGHSEKKAVAAVNRFLKPFGEFWDNQGVVMIEAAARTAILGVGFGLLNLVGVPLHSSICALAVSAAAGGKPIIEVLKAAKGLFKPKQT